MAPGINFTLGGRLDPSYRATLAQSVAEAKTAGLAMQNALRGTITQQQKIIGGLTSADAAEVIGRSRYVAQQQLKLKLMQAQSERAIVAATAAQSADLASNVTKAAAHIPGLSLVLRETLVIFREIGRGNWARVPGSITILVQGLRAMRAELGIFGVLFTAVGAAAVLAIGSIVGAFYIFHRRVTGWVKDMTGLMREMFTTEHIAKFLQKAEMMNQLQKDINEEIRRTREAYDSVSTALERQLQITKDRISFERELLEIQKANELAAVKNPEQRELIEKKYSTLILAKKKEERDAELQYKKDVAAQLPNEIYAAEYELTNITKRGDFMTAAHEEALLKSKKADSEVYDEYRKQLIPGQSDKRDFSADKDREIIGKLELLRTNKINDFGMSVPLSASEEQKLADAQARLKASHDTQQAVNDFQDANGERERSRARVKELEDKIKKDEEQITKLGDNSHGEIADMAKRNLAADKNELRLEQERLKRVDAGKPLTGREVTSRERVGLGAPSFAMLDVNKSMNQKLGILVDQGKKKAPGGSGQSSSEPAGF